MRKDGSGIVAGEIGRANLEIGAATMVSPSTRLAFRTRALGAAGWLEKRAGQLGLEMQEQNVATETSGKHGKKDDSPLMTLKRGDVRKLREGMRRHAAAIGEFSNWT